MLTNFPECDRRVLLSEGSEYTNDPRDPGGPTRWGITLTDARLHWKHNATAEDVKAMPRSVAETIYKEKYWDALRCDDLPAGVDYVVFDYGVNSGIGRAGRVLRHLVGLQGNEWHVTDDVLARLTKVDTTKIVDAICDERLNFLQHLSTWDHFGVGWGRRVASVKLYGEHLAHDHPAYTAPIPHVSDGSPDGAMAKAYAADDHPVYADRHYDEGHPAVEHYETLSATEVAPEAPERTTDAPTKPARPSMWSSDQGWAAAGVGVAGVSGVLQQVRDMVAQVTDIRFSVEQLLANPSLLMAVALVACGVFMWFEHRKYKNLVHQLSNK